MPAGIQGIQFNQPIQRPAAPVGIQPPPQINYQKQLAGQSPFNAMQSLIGSGYQPMDAASAYQQYQQTGQGPQPTWDNYTWAGGGGRYALPQQQASQQQQAPVPSQVGGGSTGFNLGAQGAPFNRTPFYLEPGQNGASAGPSMLTPGTVPPVKPPEYRPQNVPGSPQTPSVNPFGLTPEQQAQATATGQGGMYAGATPAGQGMRPWEVGQPGQSREETGFNFLMAQGMPEAQARQVSGWTGAGTLSSSAQNSLQSVNAFNAANSARLAAARPAYEAARARENPAQTPSISHSGGALLPQLGGGIGQAGSGQYTPPPAPRTPYTGIAGGQGNSINTYGTPGAGARLGSSGYRY